MLHLPATRVCDGAIADLRRRRQILPDSLELAELDNFSVRNPLAVCCRRTN